ncbi:hypothetical protein [uncultured Ruthenibacterium sp.]|uniref:hypothetical protein n=1 Tax=uncultured Ruthenibacterium sp. TaxID=1905347 RepID=UPI00349E7435
MTAEGVEQNYILKDGVLQCVVPSLERYYQEEPSRILALFTACAAQGCTIEVNTYAAALKSVPLLNRLPASVLRESVQNLLLSDMPEALDPLIAAGALASYGIVNSISCLHELQNVPCTMESRWWSFLRLCNANYRFVCERLGFSQRFAEALVALDRLAATRTLPQDVQELKRLLSTLPEVDYESAAKTFLLHDERWQGQIELFEQLRESREPYLVRHLAVTPAELVAAGVSKEKVGRVVRGLLDAIIKAPAVNTQPALIALAKTLEEQYR